jgi:ABC-type dipeptide/oligopeptide/nickel transport system permease subunit
VLLALLIAPVFAPYDPFDTNPSQELQPPSFQHILGTDALGRDVFSRFLYGGQRTMAMAVGAAFIALSAGLIVGATAGLGHRGVDTAILMLTNALLPIPLLIFALALITLSGAGEVQVIVATGIGLVAPMAIFTRTTLKQLQIEPYITAALSLGSTKFWLWRYYYLPNMRPLLIAYGVVIFVYALLNNAALSFLGLGGEPAVPEWGRMLADGRYVFRTAPWVALASGLGIVLLAVLMNMVARRLAR